MTIDETFIPLNFDGENVYLNNMLPTQEEIQSLECYKLTSPVPSNSVFRTRKKKTLLYIPISEWRRRLALSPDKVVMKTLVSTTQYYLMVIGDEIENPRRHVVSRIPGLRYPQQTETVATDTFFPSVTRNRGNM